MHKSIWLVAPPLVGAPVTKGWAPLATMGTYAPGRKIPPPFCGPRIDGLRHDAVLEKGFIEITHIVRNHRCACAAGGDRIRQLADAVGKIGLALFSRIEGKTRTRSHVMYDLHHRPALIAERQLRWCAVVQAVGLFEHRDARRQIAGRYVGGSGREKSVVGIT